MPFPRVTKPKTPTSAGGLGWSFGPDPSLFGTYPELLTQSESALWLADYDAETVNYVRVGAGSEAAFYHRIDNKWITVDASGLSGWIRTDNQSSITYMDAGVWHPLLNDALGPLNNTEHRPLSYFNQVMYTPQTFDLSHLAIGDMVEMFVSMKARSNVAGQHVNLRVNLGHRAVLIGPVELHGSSGTYKDITFDAAEFVLAEAADVGSAVIEVMIEAGGIITGNTSITSVSKRRY